MSGSSSTTAALETSQWYITVSSGSGSNEPVPSSMNSTPSGLVHSRTNSPFGPWPVAQTQWQGRQLRIWQAQAYPQQPAGASAGTVVATSEPGIDVATGDGVLRVERLQPAGKRPMPARDFLNAHDLDGAVFGCEQGG